MVSQSFSIMFWLCTMAWFVGLLAPWFDTVMYSSSTCRRIGDGQSLFIAECIGSEM
ncbi:hypothetical protein BgiMline_006971, partial [Biomphalaria glabrata]